MVGEVKATTNDHEYQHSTCWPLASIIGRRYKIVFTESFRQLCGQINKLAGLGFLMQYFSYMEIHTF